MVPKLAIEVVVRPMRMIKTLLTGVVVAALFAAVTIALPTAAGAQGPSASIGSHTINDVDGTVSTSLTIDATDTDLQAVGVTITYDAALVQVDSCISEENFHACNTDDAGVITIESVNTTGWAGAFTLATIDFTGLGTLGTAALGVTVDDAFDSDLVAVTIEGVDGSITVADRAPTATVAVDCLDGDGRFTFTLDNPMDGPITYTMEVDGIAPDTVTLEPATDDSRVLTGVEDGAITARVLVDGVPILESMEQVTCDPEVDISVTCADASAAISIDVTNYTDRFATYRITVGGNSPQQRSISSGLSTVVEETVTVGGPIAIVVERNGEEIYSEPTTVDCGLAGLEPTPTPTPTPMPTPDPGNGNGGGPGENQGVVEVGSASTCLAGNGRIDTNIVNTGAEDADYRIEFEGLSARQTNVKAGDWWRMPITGRPDGDYNLVVKRDGVIVSDQLITVACDTEPPTLETPEVQVVNACRAGNGYILFQFANNSNAQKSYIIEFEGVNNRSTSAAAFGGTVRAVTGRPNGDYSVHIRNGLVPMTNLTVTVDC